MRKYWERLKRVDYRRLYMSDSVVCVPYPTRQDTITVQRR